MLNTPTIEEIALYISAYDNQEIESPMCEKKFEYIAKMGNGMEIEDEFCYMEH